MTPFEINKSYNERKELFHNFINKIKSNAPWDLYTVINPTLIKNPFDSTFPNRYFLGNIKRKKFTLFASIFYCFAKLFYMYILFILSFVLYKIFYNKKNRISNIVIDTYVLVDRVNKENEFRETYFSNVYDIFEKYHTNYTILARLNGISKNPFKLVKFLKIINKDKRDILIEYELFKFNDFLNLMNLIIRYPFKTMRLLSNENSYEASIFNISLIEDMKNISIDNFTRYILGKNLAKIENLEKVYSWSEFQVMERTLNFGIRTHTNKIKIISCQISLRYETYFNMFVDDIDYDMKSSGHEVLVNGSYYLLPRDKITFKKGISLRYQNIFDFKGIEKEDNVLILGSYVYADTKNMLNNAKLFKSVIFKNHPVLDIRKLGNLPSNIEISESNIYELFKNTKIVIGTASGTSIEAVACGISVIVLASENSLTTNALVSFGQGKIWDIAYSSKDILKVYENLIKFRYENKEEIQEISSWYKNNFFIEPTKENIINVFDISENN